MGAKRKVNNEIKNLGESIYEKRRDKDATTFQNQQYFNPLPLTIIIFNDSFLFLFWCCCTIQGNERFIAHQR